MAGVGLVSGSTGKLGCARVGAWLHVGGGDVLCYTTWMLGRRGIGELGPDQ